MYFNKEKSCFVNDDGSKMKVTESIAVKYALGCTVAWGDRHADQMSHNQFTDSCAKRHARYKAYLSKELNRGIK